MAGGGASGIAVGTVAVGGVLIWSGVRGASILTTVQELIQGKKPSGANKYPITTPLGSSGGSSGASSAGGAGSGVTGAAGDVVTLALSQVGTTENPPGSNNQPYSHDLGWPAEAWCAVFICWLAKKVGQSGKVPQTASAPGMAQKFGSAFHLGNSGIQPGDIIFQHGAVDGWNGIGHVGICVSSTEMVAGNYGDRVAKYPWNTPKTVGFAKVGWTSGTSKDEIRG